MIFHIQVVTRDRVTVEADDLEQAHQIAARIAENFNRRNHHGEVTSTTVEQDTQIKEGTA